MIEKIDVPRDRKSEYKPKLSGLVTQNSGHSLKTKCYNKSLLMLYYSVALLMAKWNGSLETILN